jgi:predicted acetyltransferase
MTMFLSDPDVRYKQEFSDMLAEWKATGEELIPWVLDLDSSDFEKYVQDLNDYGRGIGLAEGKVPHSTHWLINDGRLVGVANFRHQLTEKLLASGGNIGYGIRPSERRKGYATKLLELTLEKARERGLKRVLLVCDKNNIGSARTIINNGGVLENEPLIDGKVQQRYWIEL